MKCAMFVFLSEEKTDYNWQKYKLVRLFKKKIQSLEDRITTLEEIKEEEGFINKSFGALHKPKERSQREEGSNSFPSKLPLSSL